jgi:hypothetical protein
MHKVTKTESGFSIVEVVLVIVIVGLIGTVGWLVYKNHHKTTKAALTTTSATKPATSTKTTTTTTEPANPTASWYLYTAPGNDYTMRIPDGWVLDNEGNGTIVQYSGGSLAIVPGTQGVVTSNYPQHANDDNPLLDIQWYTNTPNNSLFFQTPNGATQEPSLETNGGITIDKYYLYSSQPQTNIDEPIQGTTYTYIVKGSDSFVYVQLLVPINTTDYHANLEEALKTVVLN